MALPILGYDRLRLGIGQVLDSLLGYPVELHPDPLVLGIDHAEGMAAKSMHVAEGVRDTPIAHGDCHLVQSLRKRGPEVPVVLGAAHARLRVALNGVVQVRELERISQEEDRGVISHQVPVALLGVELDGKAADVSLGICCPPLTGYCGKACKQIGLLADLREDHSSGKPGYVMGNSECSIGT